MKILPAFALLAFILVAAPAAHALETQTPDAIMERMAFKFVRGIANMTTSIVEVPKQTELTVRTYGGMGYLIGPLKGIGMTAYRTVIGAVETGFFLVPQPGYYDPMMDPDFVWNGWEERRAKNLRELEETEATAEPKTKGE